MFFSTFSSVMYEEYNSVGLKMVEKSVKGKIDVEVSRCNG
jgi:hypothetical protein